MPRATDAKAAARVGEVLRIRLDGAEFWDLREYVREKEAEAGSAWARADGESPLSDSQIRRYQQRADAAIEASGERNRKKLLRRHAAKRRNLYAKAVAAGDIRTALACLDSEAKLLGLQPGERHVHGGDPANPIRLEAKVSHDVSDRLAPYLAVFDEAAFDSPGGTGGGVRPDRGGEPVDTPAPH